MRQYQMRAPVRGASVGDDGGGDLP